MKEEVFGIKLNDEITPIMVRDAIMNCFSEAHCADSGIESEEKK